MRYRFRNRSRASHGDSQRSCVGLQHHPNMARQIVVHTNKRNGDAAFQGEDRQVHPAAAAGSAGASLEP